MLVVSLWDIVWLRHVILHRYIHTIYIKQKRFHECVFNCDLKIEPLTNKRNFNGWKIKLDKNNKLHISKRIRAISCAKYP